MSSFQNRPAITIFTAGVIPDKTRSHLPSRRLLRGCLPLKVCVAQLFNSLFPVLLLNKRSTIPRAVLIPASGGLLLPWRLVPDGSRGLTLPPLA